MVADRHAILLLIGSMIAGIILLTSPAPIQVEIESHQVMLRLNTFKTAKSVIEYHKIGLEHEGNYFNEAHTVRAIWEGDLSRRLGLGVVDQDNFSAIFSNENPDDRTQNLTPVTKTERRAGYELLISPPKDLSLLIAFSEEDGEKLLKASKDANRATMLEFQRLAQHQNNRDGLRKYVNDVEIAFCTYSHEESRGNLITRKDGSEVIAGSPLTHHHNLIPNVVWSKEQQRFRALEVGNVSMPYLQAYYHKTLINQVQSLGYSVTREGNFWSIDGISREQVERFSPRTKQVADIAKEKGITDPKEIAKIAARYREKKSAAVPKDQLYEIWRAQLSDKEYLDLQNLKNHPKSTTKHLTVKEAIDRSLEYCLERNATAEKHKVLEYAMKIGFPSSFTPDEVKNELQSRKDIYYAQKDGKEILTTQKAHLLEEKLLQKVVAGKGTQCPLNKDFVPKEPFINSDQKSAIKGILSSKSAINCLIGKAGSGKTTVLKSIESGIRKKSKNVVAVAPSSAAVDVLRKEGFENAQTVAYLLSNTPKQKQQLQNGCLIVDEASFLPTQTLSDLVSLTKQYRCKTVLVGDPKQLNAPSAGDAMRLLTEKADIPTFSLNKILRQKDRLHAQSVTKASRGDISGSFRDLEKLNSIVEIPDKNTRFKHIADNFIASIKAKRSAIIVSPTNKERLDLTQTVYDQMKAHGLVSGAVKTFEQLKALNLTNAERKDLQTYKPNQVVRFIQKHVSDGQVFPARSLYDVLAPTHHTATGQPVIQVKNQKTGHVLTLPTHNPENYRLYEKDTLSIQKGNLIKPTINLTTTTRTKANTGTMYRCEGFTPHGDIKLDNGKVLSKNSLFLDHSVAVTAHGSQGRTVQDSYVSFAEDSFPAVTAKSYYVAISRSRERIKLFTSSKTELQRHIQKTGDRIHASEVKEHHEQRVLAQQQRVHHQSLTKAKEAYAKTFSRGVHQPSQSVQPKPHDYERGRG